MKQPHTPLKLMISGAVAAAALAVAGLSASAQTTTATTSPTAGILTTAAGTPTSATPDMILEACQRQKARTAKFLKFGIPEQFGSEEPFTFDPNTKC